MDRQGPDKDIAYQSPIFIDSLTGLYNRYFLYNIFPKFKEKAISSGTELTIFMFDIDNFKYINDTYGHLVGDSVIKEVAKLLKECIRGDDVVIRYAGDEFVILCHGRGEELVKHVGSRIIEKINKNVFKPKPQESELRLTVSGGFSVYPKDAADLEELLNYADKALYLSKGKGKNRISAAEEVTLGDITYKATIKTLSLPKFIDREREMERLKEIRQECLSLKVFFVLLKGKAGVGKSRLLDEFRSFSGSSQVQTLKVACSAQHTLQPYHMLSKAIEEYLKDNPSDLRLEFLVSQEELKVLAELIPSLKAFFPEKPEEKIVQEQNKLGINLFNGLRHVLGELAEEKGLFLYFDDLQWLDKATFELLRYFLGIESRHKIMIAATFCEETVTSEELPCRDFLSSPPGNFISLDLSPFSLEQTREFISAIFSNINAPAEFFLSVYNITAGNCLFIQEILRCLVEDGKILYKDNQWRLVEPEHLDIPSSLEEVIKRRLKKIDPETKEMLAQLAVMGKDVHLETLRKIIVKDQGYLFELIDRARENGMLGPQEKLDKVNFMNDAIQKSIYGEIDAGQKIDLHHKTEEIIKQLYKDDLQSVMGDLIYHARGAGNESKAAEYKSKLLLTSLDFFNRQLLTGYLEELSKEALESEVIPSEIGIENIETEISEEALIKVVDLIKFLLVAAKNISLYPATNKIREESVKRVNEYLSRMLEGISSLTFSELERILLVNGKRPAHRQEKESVIESFIALMVGRDIKAIQFLPGIEDREIDALLTVLALEPDDLRKRGGPNQILIQDTVTHIRISIVDYGRLAIKKISPALKRSSDYGILSDFISGKAGKQKIDTAVLLKQLKNSPQEFAKNITEASRHILKQKGLKTTDTYPQAKIIAESIEKLGKEILPGGWQAHRDDLIKLFLSLEKPLQSGLISLTAKAGEEGIDIIREVMASLSDSEAVKVITDGYTKNKESLLYMKDLFNRLVLQTNREKNISPLLEEKLQGLGLNAAEVSFVMQKDYQALSLEEKIDTLFKLPAELYSSVGLDNIKGLFSELISTRDADNLKEIITHILTQLEKATAASKEIIYRILGYFINLVPVSSDEFDALILGLILLLGEKVEEEELSLYPLLLQDIEIAINWIVASPAFLGQERYIIRKRFEGLGSLVLALYKRLEAKEESKDAQRQKEFIRELATRISKPELVELLVQQLKDPSLEYNSLIEELILKFGAPSLDTLISIVTQAADFSFEGYLYRRKINRILFRIGIPAMDKIKDYISQEKDSVKLRLLVEMISYGRGQEWVNLLQALTNHHDPEVRKEVVIALGNIGDSSSSSLLSEMCSDTDHRVAELAKVKLEILSSPSPAPASKQKVSRIRQWLKRRKPG